MRRLRTGFALAAAATAAALSMGVASAHADDPPPPDPCAPFGCLPDDRVPIDPGDGRGEPPILRPPG